MDKSKVYKRKDVKGIEQNVFRHDKVFNLNIDTDHIAPDYSLTFSDCNDMSDTGLVELFNVSSEKSGFPSFKARWDERDDQVDIDIINVDKRISQLFKNGKSGYSGHHSKKTIDSPRTYLAEIKIPERLIFRGNITFNINQGHAPDLFLPRN